MAEHKDSSFHLTKPGYKVFTAKDVTDRDYPEEIYAVFEVEPDDKYTGRK